jgi:peroxiredoxin
MPGPEQRVRGQAFEVYDPGAGQPKVVDQMRVVTRYGSLHEPGQEFPGIVGRMLATKQKRQTEIDFRQVPGIKVISVVNEFGTPDCDLHTRAVDFFANLNPEIHVFSVSKQDPKDLRNISRKQNLSHKLVSIDREAAIDAGLELEPDQDENGEKLADDFWFGALRRVIFLVGVDNIIKFVEQSADQAKQPNLEAVSILAHDLQR